MDIQKLAALAYDAVRNPISNERKQLLIAQGKTCFDCLFLMCGRCRIWMTPSSIMQLVIREKNEICNGFKQRIAPTEEEDNPCDACETYMKQLCGHDPTTCGRGKKCICPWEYEDEEEF